ncbi:sulfur oxidation c-type cytochrome SoxA [Solemya velum gill symbiont]|uniref:SoxAX cytochrome complex subunit A n=1 Tax=Solemya velum gill symbiont TaxID=2340 RepID=A0A1T2MVD5_SOVGS|nr:sulfur oxidation c-type cytochrome SoxA [Solemya velum gill symbiont]OOY35249.1 sulfur oxidation c-type cytochrome SoxA [Solemya velum gill symbiont]OOY37950.1 sulfur oxidation c-type cytochrome SoxA [Solemya velum gill symbiont]OOY44469.1 sulfur oxidation c-type cytochrome SoxA [Solemya velum gill symbiont]OOY45069.1 sulfur oxidation c-type cytochrome SoxA [Solemya velum gill symbiont]OOY48246.1 sulfur oxidation c-type cytochrome SoxA [Solemya velum gill symbiont]
MKKTVVAIATLCVVGLSSTVVAKNAADTTPAQDIETYRSYFTKKFPGVPLQEFSNGVYAIDKVSRDSWEAIEEFPPYEPFIEEGEELWNTPFANGKGYADCFKDGPAQRKNYPHWDAKRKMVVTLPLAINECREANGEKPLKWKVGAIASLLAYMGYESRGQTTNVVIPEGDADALAAYNEGKSQYFSRRGQLNFACASCHMQSSGMHVRTDILSPGLGHTTGWPVYRSKWGNLGTLHRRFGGCNKQVRAKPFKAQSKEYRNLEYFLTHMSNGIEFNGPSARK